MILREVLETHKNDRFFIIKDGVSQLECHVDEVKEAINKYTPEWFDREVESIETKRINKTFITLKRG